MEGNSNKGENKSHQNKISSHSKCGKTKEGGHRVVVVFMAACVGHIILGSHVYSVGYFYVELLQMYDESALKTSLVGTINSALICFLGPFVTMVMNRYSARVTIFAGGFLTATGCFLSFFVRNIFGLIFTFGLISGTGNALAIVPSLIVSGYYFDKHRHIVLSAVPVFTAIGMLISTPLAALFIKTFGLHGAYLMMSGQLLHICVIATICKPSKSEVQMIKKSKNKAKDIPTIKECNRTEDTASGVNCTSSKRKVLLSFVLFLVSTATTNMVFGTFQFHFPNYLLVVSGSENHTEAVMTVMGVGNALGRGFSTLVLMREYKYGQHIHITSLLASGVAAIVYPLVDQLVPLHYFFSFVLGFTTGSAHGAMASITLTIVGLKKLSTAFGFAYLFCGIGVFSGPVLASTLLDMVGTYNGAFICIGVSSLAGCLCSVVTAIIIKTQQSKTIRS